jgi:hypothetical protein
VITLLHTAQVHADTFDALRDRIAPDTRLVHLVRPDFLKRAQGGIDAALAGDIGAEVRAVSGPVLCTCTTIGAVAAAAGAIRIDAPMMQAAAQTGGRVCWSIVWTAPPRHRATCCARRWTKPKTLPR